MTDQRSAETGKEMSANCAFPRSAVPLTYTATNTGGDASCHVTLRRGAFNANLAGEAEERERIAAAMDGSRSRGRHERHCWNHMVAAVPPNRRLFAVVVIASVAALLCLRGWYDADRRAQAACRVVTMVAAERDGLGRTQPQWMRHRDIDAAESACSD